jgi:hypothetical protein
MGIAIAALEQFTMTVCRNPSVRTLVAVAFSIGLLGFADGIPATWVAMLLAALLSAALVREYLTGSPLVAAASERRVGRSRT